MNFDEIIDSISFDEFQAYFLQGKLSYIKKESHEHPEDNDIIKKELEKNNAMLSKISESIKQKAQNKSEDTLTNISYFARAISQMHPGWEEKDFKIDGFKREIEKLYAVQSLLPKGKQLKGDKLLTEFFRITASTLQDNHLSILNSQGMWPFQDKEKTMLSWGKLKFNHPTGNVGKNSAYESEKLRLNGWDVLTESFFIENKEYPLMIAQKTEKGKTTGLVAFSSCMAPYPTRDEQWKRVLEQFENKYKDWDKVILDFRGNTGGDGFQTRKVAETLYGDEVPYCLESKPRKTKEAKLRDESFSPIKGQERWKKRHFKGEQKKVYVLTDKETSSAAEAIVPMMKDYPGVQFIGENTCGCCQYGGIKPVFLPCGGQIRLGSIYREYEDGLVECIGHKPDIDCAGKNALEVALSSLPRVCAVSKKKEVTQEKGDKKQVFPNWLQNPSWLWYRNKQK